jgi:hypothetical protein
VLTVAGAMLERADVFWARFLDLATTSPDLLSTVCKHLTSMERQSLRGVNRAMRVAMNATVTSVRCSELTTPTGQQLHEVFPHLSSMRLCVQASVVDGWRVPLLQLVGNSALLLGKLRHLTLVVRPAPMTDATEIEVILELLARCAMHRLG